MLISLLCSEHCGDSQVYIYMLYYSELQAVIKTFPHLLGFFGTCAFSDTTSPGTKSSDETSPHCPRLSTYLGSFVKNEWEWGTEYRCMGLKQSCDVSKCHTILDCKVSALTSLQAVFSYSSTWASWLVSACRAFPRRTSAARGCTHCNTSNHRDSIGRGKWLEIQRKVRPCAPIMIDVKLLA